MDNSQAAFALEFCELVARAGLDSGLTTPKPAWVPTVHGKVGDSSVSGVVPLVEDAPSLGAAVESFRLDADELNVLPSDNEEVDCMFNFLQSGSVP